ncbi:hypothetical protein PFISCL1PPCAC_20642, partial [Pristionchus fissidentatus]
RPPMTPLIATRPHRTSPSGLIGSTTTTATAATTSIFRTVAPTDATGTEPTGTSGLVPTGEPVTTELPGVSAGATSEPDENTTVGGEEERTIEAGEAARPWYHRLRPMKKQSIDNEATDYPDPLPIQFLDIA